ncbi:MAG: DNA replication/repair protein RecF [Pseudohongiellaceae bacterium]
MTCIDRLNISHVRNIDDISICPGERVNLIIGANGSGKTSILESIHLLSVGRSFRSSKVAPVIQHGSSECTIYGELSEGAITIGLQKFRTQRHVLKVQGKKQPNWLEAARHLPLQVLDSNAFLLLEGSPKVRRRFLDWGVFHVEPGFMQHWTNSRTCIANRNLLLKSGRPDRHQLQAWSYELSVEADLVDQARRGYFDAFSPVLLPLLQEFLPVSELSLSYFRGWDHQKALSEVLQQSLEADIRHGITQFGPHRADIKVRIGKAKAVELLSRGQQKLLVSAMKIAQGQLLAERKRKRCIFLVDDLPAELDEANRVRVCRILASLGGQVFVTCVESEPLNKCWDKATPLARFHVEHGKIGS